MSLAMRGISAPFDGLHAADRSTLTPPAMPTLSLRSPASRLLAVAALLALTLPACSQQPAGGAPGNLTGSGPVGVFFMTRYWSYTRSLEKAAWFFTPDGRVFQNLENGLTDADLAAHRGPKGTFKYAGGQLEITWSDGKKSKSAVEPDKTGFAWDMGIFTPAPALSDRKWVVGKFEGGESLVGSGTALMTSNSFEFRADGTYTRTGVASARSGSVTTGSQGGSTGTWKAEVYSLTLTGSDGTVMRKIAFPYFDNDKSPLPGRLYFGGLLLKRER